MFTHRNFIFKRTRQGGTVRCCREKYLREDIPCGIGFCKECSSFNGQHNSESTLLSSQTYYTGMICILDYRVVLQQIAFVEAQEVVDFVVPQSVTDYLKIHNINLYRRLLNCLEQKEKRFFQFFNEFHVGIPSNKATFTDDLSYLSTGLTFCSVIYSLFYF